MLRTDHTEDTLPLLLRAQTTYKTQLPLLLRDADDIENTAPIIEYCCVS
jgi:hypothetical protein